MTLLSPQTEWRGALLQPDWPAPQGLATHNGSDPAQRFAVYRNNIVVSLIEALADNFPVSKAWVGEAVFRRWARDFVCAHPPTTAVLAEYGHGFPDFVRAASDPDADDGFVALPDLALLEMTVIDVMNEADAPALPQEVLAQALADASQLCDLRLFVHPAVRVVSLQHDVLGLWAAHQEEIVGEWAVPTAQTTPVLVWRDHHGVRILLLTPGDADAIQAIARGSTLGEVLERDSQVPDFDLMRCLAVLIRESLLITPPLMSL